MLGLQRRVRVGRYWRRLGVRAKRWVQVEQLSALARAAGTHAADGCASAAAAAESWPVGARLDLL